MVLLKNTVSDNSREMADRIGPDHAPKRSFADKLRRFGKAFTTKYYLPKLDLKALAELITNEITEKDLLAHMTMPFSSRPMCHL